MAVAYQTKTVGLQPAGFELFDISGTKYTDTDGDPYSGEWSVDPSYDVDQRSATLRVEQDFDHLLVDVDDLPRVVGDHHAGRRAVEAVQPDQAVGDLDDPPVEAFGLGA